MLATFPKLILHLSQNITLSYFVINDHTDKANSDKRKRPTSTAGSLLAWGRGFSWGLPIWIASNLNTFIKWDCKVYLLRLNHSIICFLNCSLWENRCELICLNKFWTIRPLTWIRGFYANSITCASSKKLLEILGFCFFKEPEKNKLQQLFRFNCKFFHEKKKEWN